MTGIILLDKPKDITSFGAVAEMFDLGYFETKKLIPEIKELIEK